MLTGADEYKMVEQYKQALIQRHKERGMRSRWLEG